MNEINKYMDVHLKTKNYVKFKKYIQNINQKIFLKFRTTKIYNIIQ